MLARNSSSSVGTAVDSEGGGGGGFSDSSSGASGGSASTSVKEDDDDPVEPRGCFTNSKLETVVDPPKEGGTSGDSIGLVTISSLVILGGSLEEAPLLMPKA